ncbi:M28 family peptidase [Tahibacter harae]|uniref:M28 family peptidase n=1 Tax=Tahibacter harae TaxID=2963937 RepID=A0ABT1QME8_9GAMM|nr:M28 family peptidase [Tahibacter harae]MCQ4163612.1 M28 family peptidase [Tahibacter harae]
MSEMLQNKSWFGRTLLAVIVLLVLAAALVRWRLDPVTPLGADAPAEVFSAGRAVQVLGRLLGDQRPHPVDSSANRAVQQRISETLQGLGYTVDVQDTTSCRSYGLLTCARVRNLVAVHEGSAKGKAILLSAHYDSVAAGPGASDAGSAVAALLEIARLLKQAPAGKNSVVLLFNEGEEIALLGADAFAARHPLARDIALAINIEARGTSGQSVMFETGDSSGWLVDALASTARRPLTNSLLYEVYRLMPNDTDLTVFKARGLQGLNFAHGEQLPYYHTPRDNLQELNPGSVQQHGDNVYGLVQALRNADLSQQPAGNRVYTDILGLTLLHWPVSSTLPIAAVLLLAFVFASWRLKRRYGYTAGSALRGFLSFPLSLLAGAGAAYLLIWLLSLVNGSLTTWHSSVLANRVLLWSAVLLAVFLCGRLLARRANPLGFWVGLALAWLVMGVVSALTLPGLSYLFILPSSVLVIAALVVPHLDGGARAAGLSALFWVPALAAFIVVFPTVFLVEIMIGFRALAGVLGMAAFVALAATFIAPLAVDGDGSRRLRYLSLAAAAVVIVSAVASILAPAYGPRSPQAVNVVYVQDQAGTARLLAGTEYRMPPAAVRQALGPQAALEKVLPWVGMRFHAAPVAAAALAPAKLTLLTEEAQGEGRRLTARIDAGADVQSVVLLLPRSAGLKAIEMDGQRVEYKERFSEAGDYKAFVCRGESCDGRQLLLELSGKAPQAGLLVRMSAGVPEAGRAVVQARDANAIAQGDGDQSYVISEISL